jgi:two-component system KDP operon response regulator KdpE
MKDTVLLIDNDPSILHALKLFLEREGYQVHIADSGPRGLSLAATYRPALVIVDALMPVMDGFETSRRLREMGVPAILVTSHRQDERSVVKALEMGADDYLRKPLEVSILMAKISALLRRNEEHAPRTSWVYDDGRLLIDLSQRQIKARGEPVQLTPTEFRLLSTLLHNVGRVVSHEELIRQVWGTEDAASLTSLKVYIHYLRRKIEDRPRKPYYLLAEWGIGYRFREPSPVARAA